VEDLIHSDRPTAEEALEQVMGFLEMRPEVEPLNCFELLCLHCVGHPLVKCKPSAKEMQTKCKQTLTET